MEHQIKVLNKKLFRINKNIFGHFTEHLGRCIYGGIYEENSPLSDERGFRKDVLEAIKRIKVPILRWPGGNFASNYHWEDGIGPKDERPTRIDLAWGQEESNRFGTDEFIEYCREISAEPYICVNLGTGTLDEALHWLEYCNLNGNSYYAKLRRKNGHHEPYNVKYWGVGNEIYGEWQVGHVSAREYAKKLKEFSKWMKHLDPKIKVIAVGCDDPDWNLTVLNEGADFTDYLAYHFYTGSKDYYETVSTVYLLKERLEGLMHLIKSSKNPNIKIALDEWNVWYRVMDNKLEEEYDFKDGLFACGTLMLLQRMSDKVPIANLAQLVNALGAIHTEKDGLYLTPVYRAFELLVNHSGDLLLNTFVKTDTYDIEGTYFYNKMPFKVKNVPFIDATATMSADGRKLFLSMVNYNKDDDLECQIDLEDFEVSSDGKIYEYNAPNIDSKNDFDNPELVKIHERKIDSLSNNFKFFLPKHSCTVFEVNLK